LNKASLHLLMIKPAFTCEKVGSLNTTFLGGLKPTYSASPNKRVGMGEGGGVSWAPNIKKYNTFRRSTKEEGFFVVLIFFIYWGSKCEKITPSEGVQKRRDFLWFLIFYFFGGSKCEKITPSCEKITPISKPALK
jgi:hypothetical protein